MKFAATASLVAAAAATTGGKTAGTDVDKYPHTHELDTMVGEASWKDFDLAKDCKTYNESHLAKGLAIGYAGAKASKDTANIAAGKVLQHLADVEAETTDTKFCHDKVGTAKGDYKTADDCQAAWEKHHA